MEICIYSENTSLRNQITDFTKLFLICESIGGEITALSGTEIPDADEHRFDIILIDLDTNPEKAVETAEALKELSPKAIFIFLTEQSDILLRVFGIGSIGVIRIPLCENEFCSVLASAAAKHKEENPVICLKYKTSRYRIPVDEIGFVEGYRRHLTVYTAKRKYEVVGKISDIHDMLKSCGFIRVHQGFIVNIRYIKRIDNCEVELTDGTKLPLSVRKRQSVLNEYDYLVGLRQSGVKRNEEI